MSPALRALIGLAALAAAGPAAATAEPPDAAFGQWLTADGMAHVAIAPCSDNPAHACGAVTWLKDPVGHPTRDINNPDAALRQRPLVGVLVIREMTNQGPGRWVGGKIYDAETGKTYDGKLKALSANRLQVTGCVLMVCQDRTWTRVD